MKFKLKESFGRETKGNFIKGSNFITNGKFMIHKDLTHDPRFYDIYDSVDLERVIPDTKNSNVKTWLKTEITLGISTVFICENEEDFALFDKKYIDFFKIETLEGTARDQIFWGLSEKFFIMPMRIQPDNAKLKKTLNCILSRLDDKI